MPAVELLNTVQIGALPAFDMLEKSHRRIELNFQWTWTHLFILLECRRHRLNSKSLAPFACLSTTLDVALLLEFGWAIFNGGMTSVHETRRPCCRIAPRLADTKVSCAPPSLPPLNFSFSENTIDRSRCIFINHLHLLGECVCVASYFRYSRTWHLFIIPSIGIYFDSVCARYY